MLRAEHPKLTLFWEEEKTRPLIERIETGTLDAGILAAESDMGDLFEAIERGDFPRWSMEIQGTLEDDAANYGINPFDVTQVWPHADYPRMPVGELVPNRNAENYFADVSKRRLRLRWWCRASVSRPTGCSRAGSSPTRTRTATVWASIITRSPSTRRGVPCRRITGTAPRA